ncbi:MULTISPECIES: peptidylprolyl isomerase [Acidithrix]|uniref:Foldase protein PrsA n=1 Tax=Acidithrix ferrooxidans TaxID=1280514 RepID=A0A0D8HIF4_9ACTN|nr:MULTISPECIES: peptidylprolyl isomerase [Acidithrix]KJF17713.1 foldase protein PrsA [Acidithrix ferrooxidans]CAG4924270.1 unnamed protein product [Acidithrix sp. C25]
MFIRGNRNSSIFSRKRLMVGGVFGALAITASACNVTPYAASVGSSYISVSSLNSELASLAANKTFVSKLTAQEPVFASNSAGSKVFSTKFVDQVLNRRISVDLISQAVAKLGLHISPSEMTVAKATAVGSYGGTAIFDQFPKSYQAILTSDTADITVLEAYITKANISIPALRSYYQANPTQFDQICAAHILVPTLAKAQSLLSQLRAGASFVTLARSNSTDTNTAPNGGYIGCGLDANFASAFGSAFASEVATGVPNQALTPVALGSSYSIPMVVSRTQISFTNSIANIVSDKFGANGSASLNAFIAGEAKGANVNVNPAYGTFSINTSNSAVNPPALPKP